MAKKINCKHDLDKKQEIQARRLRVKLEAGENETLETYHRLYIAWWESKEPHFADFLKKQDIVYYSAYTRITEQSKIREINTKIMFYGVPAYYGYPIC